MRIKRLQIINFKSLVDFELRDLRPFCAFVGPNASGKSNIFEALEFTNNLAKYGQESPTFFGGAESIYSYSASETLTTSGVNQKGIANLDITDLSIKDIRNLKKRKDYIDTWQSAHNEYDSDFEQFVDNFSLLFINKHQPERAPVIPSRLSRDASNLSKILGIIF